MRLYVSVLFLALMCGIGATAYAAPGDAIASATQRSIRAEVSFRACQGRSGPAAIACISTAVNAYAVSLSSCNHIRAVAPAAPTAAREAASAISTAKTKPAALSVLNRVRSVLRGLAAKSQGEAQSVYNRINKSFATAIRIINSVS